jgi:hypothetical protein
LDELREIGFVLPKIQLQIVHIFYSIRKIENRSIFVAQRRDARTGPACAVRAALVGRLRSGGGIIGAEFVGSGMVALPRLRAAFENSSS